MRRTILAAAIATTFLALSSSAIHAQTPDIEKALSGQECVRAKEKVHLQTFDRFAEAYSINSQVLDWLLSHGKTAFREREGKRYQYGGVSMNQWSSAPMVCIIRTVTNPDDKFTKFVVYYQLANNK